MTDPKAEALRLHLSGYCPGSNKYRMAGRLDREDWREHMARDHTKGWADREKAKAEGDRWAFGMSAASAASFYRSCVTKDTLERIEPEVFNELKRLDMAAGGGFGWGCWTEYLPLKEKEAADERAK